MKLCFPVSKNKGTQSTLFSHFRLAPLLLVVDSETMAIDEVDNRQLRNLQGQERFRALLGDMQIDAVLTYEIGMGAYRNLQAAGITIFQALPGTIAENITAFTENNLKEFEMEISDMNGQDKSMRRGMGQGRGMNCRGTGMGRKQGMAAGQGFGRGRNFAAKEIAEPGMGRGLGQR